MKYSDIQKDALELIPCKCEVCGWIDDFTEESLNKERCAYGFCDDCDQERIFQPD